MYIDAQLRFSNQQSLAVAAGTTLSTNNVDLLSANTNLGVGVDRRGYVKLRAAMTGGTSLQVQYIQSANADMSSPDVLATGGTIATANLTAGAIVFDQVLPRNTKRYVAFQYVTVGTFAAGTVDAMIVSDRDATPYYPANTGF